MASTSQKANSINSKYIANSIANTIANVKDAKVSKINQNNF